MKATGIVRRIDDLGRVVIPKEIRRTMRIREGDPLEIFTNSGGEVIFKKYSPVKEIGNFAAEYADALSGNTELAVIICDKDHCVAAAGLSKREVLGRSVTPNLDEIMENRKTVVYTQNEEIYALEGVEKKVLIAAPIIAAGDITGVVVFLEGKENSTPTDSDIKLANVAAKFLSHQTE